MLHIEISDQAVGLGLMYEKIGRQGRQKLVPIYRAMVLDEHGDAVFEFDVLRQVSDEVFLGQARHYGQNGECPPTLPGGSYGGRIVTYGRLGFAIVLYDYWSPSRDALIGMSRAIRRGIKIHRGPGTSFGCFMVAGAAAGYRRFVKAFKALSEEHGDVFRVTVLERTD